VKSSNLLTIFANPFAGKRIFSEGVSARVAAITGPLSRFISEAFSGRMTGGGIFRVDQQHQIFCCANGFFDRWNDDRSDCRLFDFSANMINISKPDVLLSRLQSTSSKRDAASSGPETESDRSYVESRPTIPFFQSVSRPSPAARWHQHRPSHRFTSVPLFCFDAVSLSERVPLTPTRGCIPSRKRNSPAFIHVRPGR
jgi:hypothetical protein